MRVSNTASVQRQLEISSDQFDEVVQRDGVLISPAPYTNRATIDTACRRMLEHGSYDCAVDCLVSKN